MKYFDKEVTPCTVIEAEIGALILTYEDIKQPDLSVAGMVEFQVQLVHAFDMASEIIKNLRDTHGASNYTTH